MTWEMVQKLQNRVNELETVLEEVLVDLTEISEAHDNFEDESVGARLVTAMRRVGKVLVRD